jgi:predicted nucleic acid-binding protein
VKVFLDTNVLVAAFATRGLCADVFRLVLLQHDLIVTAPVLEELHRVLVDKIGLPADQAATAANLWRDFSVTPRDPADIPVVLSAIAAGADVLITGDKDLLDAELPLHVLSPRAFWEMVRRTARDEVHEQSAAAGPATG